MSTSDPILKVSNLQMRYGSKEVLKGISFEVPRGEIFGFIGPNGAGKTTTIRILATLLMPTGGDVWIAGDHVLCDPQEVRRKIGYMPDHVGVYPGLTVYEYLYFFASAYRVPRRIRSTILTDVIDLTDLGDLVSTQVHVLSKGMRQRLCLAQTLIHDPDILLLDEPASGLDPRARIEFRALLRELRRLGKTILLSSHILKELSELCDSVGIIESGSLVADGSVSQILDDVRSTKSTYEVELHESYPHTLETVLAVSGVETATLEEQTLRFSWKEEDREIYRVFAALCERKIAFNAVRRQEDDLESLFMKLTRGEVS